MCRQECAASCPASSCPHRTRADQCTPPFFRAFHALAVDDGGGRTGLSLLSFPTLFIERVVDSCQRAVIRPHNEVIVDPASPRPVFPDRAPLAARRSNRRDIPACCGRNGRGSCSSTSVSPPRIRPPLLNHR